MFQCIIIIVWEIFFHLWWCEQQQQKKLWWIHPNEHASQNFHSYYMRIYFFCEIYYKRKWQSIKIWTEKIKCKTNTITMMSPTAAAAITTVYWNIRLLSLLFVSLAWIWSFFLFVETKKSNLFVHWFVLFHVTI